MVRQQHQGEDEPTSADDSIEFDVMSDTAADETLSRVPTGFTGELDFDDDELDFASFDDDDDMSRSSTGFTGELADLGDDFDLDFLDEVGDGDEVSLPSTGLTGELTDLGDDFDLDMLDGIDIDDLDIDDFDIDDIDIDDLDLDDIPLTGLTGELANLDLDDDVDRMSTGLTGELQDADDELDLSFLDEVEVDEPDRVSTGELQDTDDEMDLSFLDEVDEIESETDDAGEADEEFDLSFLDEEDEESNDWFGESDDFEEAREPDWMQTLNEASDEDLIAETEDGDVDDIFDSIDMDDMDFDSVEMAAPAADLDSLLSTFDEVQDSDFAEDESLSQIDNLDAIFDAALSQEDDDSHDDLPDNRPEWLQDIDISSDESSAAAIIRQQADRPLYELDDRLQAIREKGLSASSQTADEVAGSGVLSGVSKTLSTPQIDHEIGVLISDVSLSSDQQKQSTLLQEIVGVTITSTVATDADGVPIVESSRRSRRYLPNIGLGRLLITSILILVMIIPFVSNFGVGSLPPVAFGSDNPNANAVFNEIETLNEGDWVLVGFEYGPTAAGELDSVADILLRHMFSRGAKPIIVSSNPVAIVHVQNVINNIQQSIRSSGIEITANEDYYIARYLSGGTLGLRDLSQNLDSIVRINAKGIATNLTISSLDEMALMLLIAEGSDDIRNWAEQISPSTSTRLVAATGYAAQPLAEPYVNQTDGIVGLMVGYRDAYTYGEMLQGLFATPTPAPTETFTATYTETPIPSLTDTPMPSDTPAPTETVDSEDVDATADSSSADDVTPAIGDDDATDVPTETPLPTDTPEPTATPTSVPTDTPEPTNTSVPTNTPQPTATPNLITVIVITAPDGSVNVRTGPGTTFNVVTTVEFGEVFQVIEENDDGSWIHFLLPDGRDGWIASFLVEKTELPEAEVEGDASDDSASAGRGVTVMQMEFTRRMGKNNIRYSQQQPTVTGTPPTQTFTPSPTFTPSVTPTATLTPTATPDPRATFAFARDRKQEESRLNAITLGTIAAVVIILLGNIFYGLRAMAQRRRESKR